MSNGMIRPRKRSVDFRPEEEEAGVLSPAFARRQLDVGDAAGLVGFSRSSKCPLVAAVGRERPTAWTRGL